MGSKQVNTIIIGAGPIGIEVAAALKHNGVDYLHLEAGQIGHSITRWMPMTTFFSSPEWIALCGIPIQSADQRQIDGEGYLAYMRQLVEILELPVRTFERVTEIATLTSDNGTITPTTNSPADPATNSTDQPRFRLTTQSRRDGVRHYHTRNIVLAVGNMQQHNRLTIPGVDQPHVTHDLADPHTYFRQRLLIVGGKNSALEAALRCWRAGAIVTVSHRRPQISNRGVLDRIFLEIGLLIKNKQITLLSSTEPVGFGTASATLHHVKTGTEQEIAADFAYLATGFRPDNSLYQQLGVELVGEEQRPQHNPQTLETNTHGVYVAGTATAGNQPRYTVFITTCHHHAQAIAIAITGNRTAKAASGNYPLRNYTLTDQELE